jgi:spore germination cell wall hydrolase CwlJ-like protein
MSLTKAEVDALRDAEQGPLRRRAHLTERKPVYVSSNGSLHGFRVTQRLARYGMLDQASTDRADLCITDYGRNQLARALAARRQPGRPRNTAALRTSATLILMWVAALAAPSTAYGAPITERVCVALAVYGEARGESFHGKALVARVIQNRARLLNKSLCDVVSASRQFQGIDAQREPWADDPPAWTDAMLVADSVIVGDYYIPEPYCARATHFWKSSEPMPAWAVDMETRCVVGAHTFAFRSSGPR